MRNIISLIVFSLLLVGCSKEGSSAVAADAAIRDTPHSTAEYLADPAMMQRTIAACSAENDIQLKEFLTHAGCKTVFAAMHARHHHHHQAD